jgi:hypothetical protein
MNKYEFLLQNTGIVKRQFLSSFLAGHIFLSTLELFAPAGWRQPPALASDWPPLFWWAGQPWPPRHAVGGRGWAAAPNSAEYPRLLKPLEALWRLTALGMQPHWGGHFNKSRIKPAFYAYFNRWNRSGWITSYQCYGGVWFCAAPVLDRLRLF